MLTEGEGQKTIIATAYDLAGNMITETVKINFYYNSDPLSISYIDGAFNVEDYYKSSENVLTIHGYHLFEEDVNIYPKNNPSNLATTTQNTFTLQISESDGYLGLEGHEKSNLITLVANSPGTKNHELNVRIIKDDKGPLIELVQPSTYYTKSNSPNIIVETDEQSYCELNNLNMNSGDRINHQLQLSQIIKTTPITITCSDLSGKQSTLEFDLEIDTTQPYIYYTELYGAKLISQKGSEYSFLLFVSEETNIETFANEPVICKYGPTTNYNEMTNFKDQPIFSSQQISNKLTLETGQYTLYTICEDRAGNPSKAAKLNIVVNTELPIQVSDIKPSLYTNQKNPELNFNTYRNATCTITTVDEYNAVTLDYASYKYKEKSIAKSERKNSLLTHSTIISEKAGELEQKELKDNTNYAFEIDCESNINGVEDSETKYLYFTTDFTPPTILISEPLNGIKTNASYLSIVAETETNSNYTISVNNQQQSYSTITTDGKINNFVILEDGVNTILIEVIDKAGNTAQSRLLITYNNIGPSIGTINPSNNEVLPPINKISAEIIPEKTTPSVLETEFNLFIFNQKLTQVTNPGEITKQLGSAILNINNPYTELPEGTYRLYTIPKDIEGITGQGKNILFIIGENNPIVTLSKPYNKRPYTGTITNKQKTEFAGLISSATLLKSELFINSELSKQFNEKSFNIYPELQNGLNQFVLEATTTEGYTTIIHGDITLDIEGPNPIINIE